VNKITIGVVDYGVGNHTSVRHCLHDLELRCRVTDDPAVLQSCHLLLLPGVGAFRPAIEALRAKKLDGFLLEQARGKKPILGICLGMQLLTDVSHEDGETAGLGLIPGSVVPLAAPRWHIGWNTIEQVKEDPIFRPSTGQSFYFNHSYAYRGAPEFQVCKTKSAESFASVIRRDNVVGVQFHPEKSQAAGHALLRQIVEGMCGA
jgi:imidazole glycerol-phosphate synthase subunit HisH